MILSHSHRFIFIKSAKTAGTSLESALSNDCDGKDLVAPIGATGSSHELQALSD